MLRREVHRPAAEAPDVRTTGGGPLLEYSEADGIIELTSPMPLGRRVLFALLALFPLIAPYELLVKPAWETWLHPAFLFALTISLGALAVSALLVFASVAGLEQRLRFETKAQTFTYWRRALVVASRSSTWSFSAIESIELVVHEWSDGPDSYSVQVLGARGTLASTGSTDSRSDAERCVARLKEVVPTAGAS